MADEEDIDVSKPKEPPKPVHIGGESLADRILPHLKKIIVTIIVIAVILSVVFGIRAWKHSKQSDETEKVAKVLQLGARRLAAPPNPMQPTPSKDPTFPDVKTRATEVLDAIAKKDADDVGDTYRGGLLLDAGRLDEAIKAYTSASTKSGIEGVLAREGLGIALETKAMAEKDSAARQALLEQALAAFAKMQLKKDGPRYAYGLYHQGRVQQTLGKTAEAKALFEQARDAATANRELGGQIEKRLASLGGA